jgi:toxin ParE1/3/4
VTKPRLRLSDAAISDILEQADWYAQRSSLALAERWENAVAAAFVRITKNPNAGAHCQFKAVELRGVRRMPISKFPKHLIFYRNDDNKVLVLRVVHGARDLESLF